MMEARKDIGVTFRRVAQRIRVPAGFAVAPLLLVAAMPTPASLIAGAVVSALGLCIRAWASGHLRKNMELTTSGPYAHTRNPLYVGTLLLGTGVAIGSGQLWFVGLFVALYLLIYAPVMSAEAQTMRDLFPREYEEYSRHVPLFAPRVPAYRAPKSGTGDVRTNGSTTPDEKKFDRGLYLRHREYRAALGTVLVYILLVAKMYFVAQR